MGIAASSKTPPASKRDFKGSLVRTVVGWLLVLTLVPVFLVGVVTYIRMRGMLTSQANAQLQAIVNNYSQDLEQFSNLRQEALRKLVQETNFGVWIDTLGNPDKQQAELSTARTTVVVALETIQGIKSDPMFDELFLLDNTGKVLAATNAKRYQTGIQDTPQILDLLGTNQSRGFHQPSSSFPGDFVWFTSYAYLHRATGRTFTFMGVIDSPSFVNLLEQSSRYLTSSKAYLFTGEPFVLGLSESRQVTVFDKSRPQTDYLNAIVNSAQLNQTMQYVSTGDVEVMSYARWMPKFHLGLVLEVPISVVYDQMRFITSFFTLVMLVSFLVVGITVFYGANRLVNPILTLVETVRNFTSGDWNYRAKVTRRDELGLLAYSFNLMAEELSRMYRSLETKVEERNRQLTTASEIAQVVTSNTSREDICHRTVSLVTERFNYDYACIYLLDSSGVHFNHREAGGQLSLTEKPKFLEGRIRSQSAFGMAISNNQVMVLADAGNETTQRPETMLDNAKSEVIIPIAAGNQVFGLLDVQSMRPEEFGSETVDVIKMLAAQIANGLQNIQLLESARIDLQETSLLYQSSRRVTQAQNRDEISTILSETLLQTPYMALILEADQNQLRAGKIMDGKKPDRTLPPLVIPLSRVLPLLQDKHYLMFDRLTQPSEFFTLTSFFAQNGYSQVALIPVFIEGELIQVLALGSRAANSLTDATLQPYLNLIEVVANTEARFRVLATLEYNVAELKTVATVSEAISAETDLATLFKLLHRQIIQSIGGNLGFFIALYDEQSRMIEIPYIVEYDQNLKVDPFPLGEGLTSILIKNREPMLLSENAIQKAAALGAKIVGVPARSWVGVPLIIGGQVIGAMVAEDTETDGRFTERELRLFTILAPQVAVSIRNAQLLTEMQQALAAYDQERFLLNTLLDNIPDQVAFKDTEARYIRASQSLVSHHRATSSSELVGKTETDLDDSETARETYRQEKAILETSQPQTGSVEKQTGADGRETWALVSRMPMVNQSGEVTGVLGISRDISELKQAEELAQRRAQQLRTAAEIARDTSSTLNLNELLARAVTMVRDRFGFYHASIFLLDALSEYAVLRESTGEAGRQLKEAGHSLAVGSQSIVGQTTALGRPLVVNDVTLDPNYYPNPLLPKTRAELAIPLKAGERILGALDVQSIQPGAFTEDDINILQVLADQMAIAIMNADMFVETQENITKHRFLHQITTAAASCNNIEDALATSVEGLTTALDCDRVAVYLADRSGGLVLRAYRGYDNDPSDQLRITAGEGIIGTTALSRSPILVKDTLTDGRFEKPGGDIRSQLAVPILYSDRAIGVLCIDSKRIAAYDENDQEILGSLGNNLGAILSNAQLLNQIREQIEQQKMLFEITSKIRRSTDVDTILQTSAREMCNAIHAQRARIEITIGQAEPPVHTDAPNGHQPEPLQEAQS